MWSEGPEPQADLVRSLIQLSKSWRQTVCRSWHFLTDMREARYEWGMDAFSNSGARLLRKFRRISQETKNLPEKGSLIELLRIHCHRFRIDGQLEVSKLLRRCRGHN
jgi:hypothetical protein